MKIFEKILIFLLSMSYMPFSQAVPYHKHSDSHLQGYVQSLFVHSYGLASEAVTVKNGYIYVQEQQITSGNNTPEQLAEKLEQATSQLEGVKGIVLVKADNTQGVIQERQEIIDGFMPHHSLFNALIADPKWPRFTLAYQNNFKNGMIKQGFSPNFGASFPIYHGLTEHFEWEFGIQGGLFALFDIGRTPSALINADYYISFPFSFHTGPWSGMVRAYHQSSHLGDEFMLSVRGHKVKRINLSFEGIEAFLSYHFMNGIRMYGGTGCIVHKDPDYIKRFKVQGGAEYRAENTFWEGRLRPVTGIDIKSEQMAGWVPGYSFKTGVQIENSALISHEIQLMFEAYTGKSMQGQFYNEKIRYIGVGLHAFL